MAGFDMKCPFCNVSLESQADSKWRNGDCPTDFDLECFSCGRLIHVAVHQVPEFETMVRKCEMCNVQIGDGENYYCGRCRSRLSELSDFTKAQQETAKAANP